MALNGRHRLKESRIRRLRNVVLPEVLGEDRGDGSPEGFKRTALLRFGAVPLTGLFLVLLEHSFIAFSHNTC